MPTVKWYYDKIFLTTPFAFNKSKNAFPVTGALQTLNLFSFLLLFIHNSLNMKKFLCTFRLPELLEESFWEQIPLHRKYINSLMEAEKIVTYSVNHNRTKGWVVVNARTEAEAKRMIERFPIREFISFEIDELFIFDSMIGAPRLVLN